MDPDDPTSLSGVPVILTLGLSEADRTTVVGSEEFASSWDRKDFREKTFPVELLADNAFSINVFESEACNATDERRILLALAVPVCDPLELEHLQAEEDDPAYTRVRAGELGEN